MRAIFKHGTFLLVVQLVNSGVLPVDKCNLEDSTCMTAAFQKALPIFADGMPELGVEVMDVMQLDDLALELFSLKYTVAQGTLEGLKSAVVDNVVWNPQKKTIDVSFHFGGHIKGHYTTSGSILHMPVTGDGLMDLKLVNFHIRIVFHYVMEKDAEGKDHVLLTKYVFTFNAKEHGYFDFTNLYNGNKEMSDAMLKFINTNWKQIGEEFAHPVFALPVKKIYKNMKVFLQKIPIADLASV